ncbi:aspartyl protease [Lodderomyces elongisporus]|uniref:aspartyl protease n=1 Tax=Lodderomyces elongisporus TaxID=36914 RepID=UPI0029228F5F|nr:aspartyl protease [Lodderomyces elongisporus]WLF78348.1 aspartyl protease [Lodderomyces elongisporus]
MRIAFTAYAAAAVPYLFNTAEASITKEINTSPLQFKRDSNNNGFVKLDFNVRRGSSRSDVSPTQDSLPRLVKRADPDGSFEMELSNQQTFYMAELKIGSNQDKNQVLVDTGSSDLWVMSHDLNCISSSSSSSSSSKKKKKKRDAKNVFNLGTGIKLSLEDEEEEEEANQVQKRQPKNVFNFGTGVTLPSEDELDEVQKRAEENDNEKDKEKDQVVAAAAATTIKKKSTTPTKVVKDSNGEYYTTIYYTGTAIPSSYASLLPDGGGGGGIGGGSGGSGGSSSSSAGSSGGSGGSNTCTSYGSFNTENSDTWIQNNTDAFLIQYADGTHALGVWGMDTVEIGDVSVNNVSFAVANETSSDVGVFGLGLPMLETTTQYGYTYENFPIKLKNAGVIDRVVFSLYLAQQSDSTGSVLFGAVDHAKYEGSLVSLPMLRTYQQISVPVRFEVELQGISFNSSGDSTSISDESIGVVLDSGSTLSYIRSSEIESIAKQLSGRYSSSSGVYIVSCDYLDSDNTLDLDFGNVTIRVPISDLVLQATRSQCYLGLFEQSSSSSYILFGDNILRSAYIVYDLENYEISLAQAYYTNSEDVEVITSNVPLSGGHNSSSLSGGSSSSGSSSSDSSSSNKKNISSSSRASVSGMAMGLLAALFFML